jgi:hypothetical protein
MLTEKHLRSWSPQSASLPERLPAASSSSSAAAATARRLWTMLCMGATTHASLSSRNTWWGRKGWEAAGFRCGQGGCPPCKEHGGNGLARQGAIEQTAGSKLGRDRRDCLCAYLHTRARPAARPPTAGAPSHPQEGLQRSNGLVVRVQPPPVLQSQQAGAVQCKELPPGLGQALQGGAVGGRPPRLRLARREDGLLRLGVVEGHQLAQALACVAAATGGGVQA